MAINVQKNFSGKKTSTLVCHNYFTQACMHHLSLLVIMSDPNPFASGSVQCCANFRERIWGSLSMTHAFLQNTSCWFEHMQLDMETGMDPEDAEIKLRAAEGLEAVDFFMPGYHVWAKLIESLADAGYDSNNLVSVHPIVI